MGRRAGLTLALALAWFGMSLACGDEGGVNDVEPTAASTPATFEMDAGTVLHHWQALNAIDHGDVDDARHHVEHILDAVGDDEAHAAAMRAVLASLDAGDPDEAEHGIEGMLAGRAEPALTATGLHLQMALTAMKRDDAEDVRHHLEHVATIGEADHADVEEIMRFLDEGHHDEAAEHLAAMVAVHGARMEMEADDGEGHEAELEADREATVVMTEFAYDPSDIHAQAGERVRLVVVNRGAVLHDLTAEEFDGEVEVAGGAGRHESTAGDHHTDAGAFHVAVNSGKTAELVFEAHEPGEYTLFCTVPGHRDLGMTAQLTVE